MYLFINNYDFIPNPKRTGKVIKELMKKHDLKYQQLADILFVEVKTIDNWIQGRSYPELDTLVEIKNHFNITLDDLLIPDSKPIVKDMDLSYFYVDIDSKAIDSIKLIEGNKKDIIAFDYYIQKYFFSYLDSKDVYYLNPYDCHTYFGKSIMEVLKEIDTKIKEKYGEDYRVKLRNNTNSDLKNVVSFEILKYVRLGKINVNIITEYKENDKWYLNQFEDAIKDFIEYDELCYFVYFLNKSPKFQIELLSLLSPIERDIVYNGLLSLNDENYAKLLIWLFEHGAKKLKFAQGIKPDREDITDVNYRYGNVVYKILNVIKDYNYNNYLDERID